MSVESVLDDAIGVEHTVGCRVESFYTESYHQNIDMNALTIKHALRQRNLFDYVGGYT